MIFANKRLCNAFTLLEMSIVMVIIGLLVGGTLLGKDMLDAAKDRALITQIEQLNASVNGFEDKYSYKPGDYIDASSTIDQNAIDGDGNGMITATSAYPTTFPSGISITSGVNELAGVFHHLTLADLSPATYNGDQSLVTPDSNIPEIKGFNGGIILFTSFETGYLNWYLGIAQNAADGDFNTQNVLLPRSAFAIDEKMDDGLPEVGFVQARIGDPGNSAYINYVSTPPNDECITDGPSTRAIYKKNEDLIECQVLITQG